MDVTQIVVLVLALVAGVVAGYVIKARLAALEAIPDQWDWLLTNAVKIAVNAAEQLYESTEGQAKLDYAIDYVDKFLEKYGIELDPVLVRGAIEAAVKELKDAAVPEEE